MYDISQLNDMLVPELKDIADQLSIPNANKTDKKDLIYKILDRQAAGDGTDKPAVAERPRRKRIAKATTPSPVEEAVPAVEEIKSQPEAEDSGKKENFKSGQKRGRRVKTQKNETQLE